MTPETYQYYKFKFKSPDLTLEQAQRIENFQETRLTYSLKYSLSFWEEQDYELSAMREILNADQLMNYDNLYTEACKRHEHELIEQDSKKSNEILYYEEHLRYVENNVLPDIFNDLQLQSFLLLTPDLSRINFLKTEYKAFLEDEKFKMISEHFRHKRIFQPNQLNINLLKLKIIHSIPDYDGFHHYMDKPAKRIAKYLASKIEKFSDTTENLIKAKIEDLESFAKANQKKYFSEQLAGWHIAIPEPPSPRKMRQIIIMTMLLLDKEKYGG